MSEGGGERGGQHGTYGQTLWQNNATREQATGRSPVSQQASRFATHKATVQILFTSSTSGLIRMRLYKRLAYGLCSVPFWVRRVSQVGLDCISQRETDRQTRGAMAAAHSPRPIADNSIMIASPTRTTHMPRIDGSAAFGMSVQLVRLDS
jgi:hypothetical protein